MRSRHHSILLVLMAFIPEKRPSYQEQFHVQCILTVEDNVNFVHAFLYSKDAMVHDT